MSIDNDRKYLYSDLNSITKVYQMSVTTETKRKQKAEPFIKSAFNPWTREYSKTAKKQHHNTNATAFVVSTGEDAQPVATFTTTYAVDKEQFCKLYLDGVGGLCKLNQSGMKVFYVVFSELRKNIGKDKIQMSYANCLTMPIPISPATYARGVRNLYENDFIKPVEGYASTWWINPDYIFNGNRLNINSTYVLKNVDPQTGEIYETH